MANDKDAHEAFRLAGMVKRLHTVPTIREHTISDHVYGSLLLAERLLRENPVCDKGRVFTELLYHDVPEIFTGDTPAPTKRHSPGLRQALSELEKQFQLEHGLVNGLTMTELHVVKACDTLDLGWTCVMEARLGNRTAALKAVMHNVLMYVTEQHHLPGVMKLAEEVRIAWESATQ